MDPRTGRRQRGPQASAAQPGADGPPVRAKLKSVSLFVEWGYDGHHHSVPARVWRQILAGRHIVRRGTPYHYEGERFSCWWEFNGREGPGSLIVSYSGGGDGYVGTYADALHQEHYE